MSSRARLLVLAATAEELAASFGPAVDEDAAKQELSAVLVMVGYPTATADQLAARWASAVVRFAGAVTAAGQSARTVREVMTEIGNEIQKLNEATPE
jgi:hypothetical protein